MAVLDLCFCARPFSSCGKRGPLFIAVRGPLTIAASLVAEHRLQTCRLSSRGSRAQLLRGMWDPPRPGLEPVSPAVFEQRPDWGEHSSTSVLFPPIHSHAWHLALFPEGILTTAVPKPRWTLVFPAIALNLTL